MLTFYYLNSLHVDILVFNYYLCNDV